MNFTEEEKQWLLNEVKKSILHLLVRTGRPFAEQTRKEAEEEMKIANEVFKKIKG